MILKLLGMILLGVLSAALSYYKKNYYVAVFDDILGREEDGNAAARVGRGFLYGFFFPVYFVLLVAGLIALISFLISIGIVAAVTFVIVWVTEKLLPHEWFGGFLLNLFKKIGLRGAPETPPASETGAAVQSTCCGSSCAPAGSGAGTTAQSSPAEASAPPQPAEKKE